MTRGGAWFKGATKESGSVGAGTESTHGADFSYPIAND